MQPHQLLAVGDSNRDFYPDDVWNPRSPAWVWPTAYYDEWNQQRKRIDATIRIGYARCSYSGSAADLCNWALLFIVQTRDERA